MACKIKTLLQCKHCRHDLEFATVCGNRRVPLLWCPDCDILYQYLGPEEVTVDCSVSCDDDGDYVQIELALGGTERTIVVEDFEEIYREEA